MNGFDSDLIRPLRMAENSFLEVLLTRFRLRRRGEGTELLVAFDEETAAIWQRHGKYALRESMPDFRRKSADYQKKLDAFLLRDEGEEYAFDDPLFPFRYASGGTLPVLRIGSEDYYCLFYRDIFPVGWNIANGGSDSRDELIRPMDTVRRELREELIIVDLDQKARYVFEDDAGRPVDRPEFAVARRYWQRLFPEMDIENLEERPIPLKWMTGPDAITVRMGNQQPVTTRMCFLNVNAEDFGIEIDRIARLRLDGRFVLCDGEISTGQLVDRIVGLFEVRRTNDAVRAGETEFIPDGFFFSGDRYASGDRVRSVVERQFREHISGIRSDGERDWYDAAEKKWDLCPVTRRLLMRCAASEAEAGAEPVVPQDFDTFISFGGPDVPLAREVYDYLRRKNRRVFFSTETKPHPLFGRAIDDALTSAEWLIGVSTHPQHLKRRYPSYEWESFHNDTVTGVKPDGKLLSVISGFLPADLPRPFRIAESIRCQPGRTAEALKRLDKFFP